MRFKSGIQKEFNSLLNGIIANLYFIKGCAEGGLMASSVTDSKKALVVILETTGAMIKSYEKEEKE